MAGCAFVHGNLYEYLFACVCVCVLNSHSVSDSKAIHCKPPHTGLHTSLVTQQWLSTPPPPSSAPCCLPTPSGFWCTEYIAHNRVLGKEGLNNTGMDAGLSAEQHASQYPTGPVQALTLCPFPPHPHRRQAAFPPHTWLVLSE